MDNETSIRLIEMYESLKKLWDPRHKEYHNKNKREDLWNEISTNFDIPKKKLKSKMKSLLRSYRRERNREKTSNATGSGAVQMLAEECKCVKLFDHPTDSEETNSIIVKELSHAVMQYAPVNLPIMGERRPMPNSMRRHKNNMGRIIRRQFRSFPDPSEQIKLKIATLIEQAILDTNRTMLYIRSYKNKISSTAEYKIGYIISYIRQERQLMNDFFDLAVAYRDNTKVLQQMKVFEYIMQGNKNITSLVRQLIKIHIEKRDSITTTTHAPTAGMPDKPTDAVAMEPQTTIEAPIFAPAPAVSIDTTTVALNVKEPGRTGVQPYFFKQIG